MAYDTGSGQLVLFGGDVGGSDDGWEVVGGTPGNDTWTWNGTTWTQQSPATSPPARYGASMAYDAGSGQLVLFGGEVAGDPSNDTWTWNGTTWTQESPATSPPAREFASMAYDAGSGQLVLFGGEGASDLNDTWTWNGTTWTQQAPATSPYARQYASMAYDAGSGQLVLIGGYDDTYPSNDTWTWNGTTWTEQSPATSPPVRWGAAMAYEPGTEQLVLFGGAYSPGGNDTWTWNGTTWTQQSPATSPPAREWASMDYDAGTGQLVLFGGLGVTSDLNDTWVYLPVTPIPTVSAVSPNSGPLTGGTHITITGTGFVRGATVVIDQGNGTVGAIAATNVRVVSWTKITAVTGGGAKAGPWNLFVTTSAGTSVASSGDDFTYNPVTVSAVSPNSGPLTGGTPITITGTGFVSGATVVIGQGSGAGTGAIAATNVVVVSSSKITAVTGGGAKAGAFNLFVTTTGGTSAANLGDDFTYNPVPTVSAVSPNSGPTAGGTAVTITGTGFVTGATVVIGQGSGAGAGAIAAINVKVVSWTKITAVTGGGAKVDIWNLFVSTSGGTSAANSGDDFTYH